MLWRVVNFLDRLLHCQHDEFPVEIADDGSLWRRCTKCQHTVQLVAKHGRVVPLASRSKTDASSNVVPLTRKKA